MNVHYPALYYTALHQVASGGACGSCAKVESLCVMVKALLINESDGAIIACDPFGFMRCALHASILGTDIRVPVCADLSGAAC
jgi:hypothetical protein